MRLAFAFMILNQKARKKMLSKGPNVKRRVMVDVRLALTMHALNIKLNEKPRQEKIVLNFLKDFRTVMII